MKKNAELIKKIIPEYSICPLIFELIWNCIAYWGSRVLARNTPHSMFILDIDNKIPFIPWTVTIYVLAFVYWTVNYILAARRDAEHAYRFFCADFITRTVAFICFVAIPTTNIRPAISGNGLFEWGMNLIYRLDPPNNLFPSLHCIASTIAAIGIATERKIPLWYRIWSFVFTAAICVSTLTTKQHVLVDVISGVSLAFIAYAAAGNKKMVEKYMGVMRKILKCFSKIETGKR